MVIQRKFKHRAIPDFWDFFVQLPLEIQILARKNFDLLKVDTGHPSLHFKRIGSLYSVRVGIKYRALGVESGDDMIWFWIGDHDGYEKLLSK